MHFHQNVTQCQRCSLQNDTLYLTEKRKEVIKSRQSHEAEVSVVRIKLRDEGEVRFEQALLTEQDSGVEKERKNTQHQHPKAG